MLIMLYINKNMENLDPVVLFGRKSLESKAVFMVSSFFHRNESQPSLLADQLVQFIMEKEEKYHIDLKLCIVCQQEKETHLRKRN